MAKKNKIGRRDFLRAGALGVAGAAIAACKPETIIQTVEVPGEKEIIKETVQVPVELTAEPQKNALGYVEWHPDEKIELEWWGHNPNDPTGPGANDRHILDAFHVMYPNIRVWINPSSWAAGITPLERLAAAFAAGVDTPDIFTMHGATDKVVGLEWGFPITEEMMPTADRERLGYQEMRLLASKGDDRVTELASITHVPVLFYDEAVYEEFGLTGDDLGTYFEDAIPVLKEVTKVDTDGTILRAGFSMWNYIWFNFPYQAGAQYFDKEAKRLVWADDEAFLYTCQFFRDLAQTHKVTSPDLLFGKTSDMSDGLSATKFVDSWQQRFNNGAVPDYRTRVRPALRLKNQVGGEQMKGTASKPYSVGIGVATNIEDPIRERAAIEFWKFVYYNAAMQLDFAWENCSVVMLKSAPDYVRMTEAFVDTGPQTRGDRTAECLRVGYEDVVADADHWVRSGQLREQWPIVSAMVQDIISTARPLKELVAEYEAQAQTDWEQNVWWVPGVVK